MKSKLFLIINLIFICYTSGKELPKYKVSEIPEELTKDAFAVVRIDQGEFQVYSLDKAVLKTKAAITILDKNADEYAHFSEYYDKSITIKNINGCVYDKDGLLIKKFKNSEIEDQSITSYSLFDDSRMKYINYYSNNYPFTVEYECETHYNGFINFPTWYFLFDYNISVEKSQFKIIIPKDYKFRYKELNLDNILNIRETESNKVFSWEYNNLKAINKEPYSPSIIEFTPIIYAAPNDFIYDGIKGNCTTWKDYGNWIYDLIKDRDSLSITTADSIYRLTSKTDDLTEKARLVYDYIQSKTRYVSIQLGIGGLQPFPANTVDEIGYGDCKALTNYTKSLLKKIGIESYYTEIYSGNIPKYFDENFQTVWSTNHVILTIPFSEDTIWLECTSQKMPFGYIHQGIADRKALMVTENGGKIIRLPGFTSEQNYQTRTIIINLDETGSGNARIITNYSGSQYENIYPVLNMQLDEQEKWLYSHIDIPSFVIKSFAYEQIKDRMPVATEILNIQLNNYASKSGKRLFIPLNILNKKTTIPKELNERKTNVVLRFPYYDCDTVIFHFPDNYQIENLPQNIYLTTDFGEYKANIVSQENEITYIRQIKIYKQTFPPEKYNELRNFFKKIVKADKMKAILVKYD